LKATLFALRSFGRELRSGEVLVLLAAVSLAVAALTAVGFLTDRIGKAVARQANEVLAADLRLRSQAPVPDEWRAVAAEFNLQTADTMSFPSVVFHGDDNALSSIKVVSDSYPLRGAVRVADELFGEQREVDGIPAAGEVWADGALLARVGADVGDMLDIGELHLRVSAVLTYRPDQSIGFASLAPTVILNIGDIGASGLIGEGSRVRYALLVAGDDDDVASFSDAISDKLPDEIRIRSQEESSERAYNAADRAQRFLSLTAVISLLLSAVAVAMSARRFAQRRMDTVALMKSLGATQTFVIKVALVQLLLLGLLGVVAGSVVGYVAEELLAGILADLLAGDLPDTGLRPVILASGSAIVLLLGFALPSMIQLRNTPPLRVLRHDEMPPAPSRLLVGGLSLAAVALLLYRSVGDPRMLVIMIGGIIVIAAALYLVGRGLVAIIGRARSGVGVAWRYGLANVSRRGRDSAVQVVAFGLGITVLLLLTLVRTDLLEGWRATLDEDAPNHFLINIQPREVDSVAEPAQIRTQGHHLVVGLQIGGCVPDVDGTKDHSGWGSRQYQRSRRYAITGGQGHGTFWSRIGIGAARQRIAQDRLRRPHHEVGRSALTQLPVHVQLQADLTDERLRIAGNDQQLSYREKSGLALRTGESRGAHGRVEVDITDERQAIRVVVAQQEAQWGPSRFPDGGKRNRAELCFVVQASRHGHGRIPLRRGR